MTGRQNKERLLEFFLNEATIYEREYIRKRLTQEEKTALEAERRKRNNEEIPVYEERPISEEMNDNTVFIIVMILVAVFTAAVMGIVAAV